MMDSFIFQRITDIFEDVDGKTPLTWNYINAEMHSSLWPQREAVMSVVKYTQNQTTNEIIVNSEFGIIKDLILGWFLGA